MINAPFGDGDCVEKEWDSRTVKFQLFSPEMKIKNRKQAL